ncbi:MAG: 1-acyl-sn-glycerol-3-phosphate acyltransferase [Spirochaetaceae bacterium]|jgi:1-acyl-sn-glycerol-3-phosphate acyltransferase|nr:1-acyl-sn-glycerol-3-phosphate acyltransferase [Spirochaetaceae bacterium]
MYYKQGKRRRLMEFVKTAFIFLILGLMVTVLTPIGLLLFIANCLGLRKSVSFLICRIAYLFARILIRLTGCDLRIRGRENIPREGGLCFVSNHCGYLDILLILATAGRTVGFIAKKELAFIPFLNFWILIMGGFFIDRKNTRKSLAAIKTGARRIQAGNSILIFPEGHRSKGQGLLPFHAGSFKLATDADAPIVPVAITGSYEVFEKTGRVKPAPVWIAFGKPIMTKDIPPGNRRQALSDRVREVIAGELAESDRELANLSC